MSGCNKCARLVEPMVTAKICGFCANSVLFCLGCSKAMEAYATTFWWNYYKEIAICLECADSVCEKGGKFARLNELGGEEVLSIEESISVRAILCS